MWNKRRVLNRRKRVSFMWTSQSLCFWHSDMHQEYTKEDWGIKHSPILFDKETVWQRMCMCTHGVCLCVVCILLCAQMFCCVHKCVRVYIHKCLCACCVYLLIWGCVCVLLWVCMCCGISGDLWCPHTLWVMLVQTDILVSFAKGEGIFFPSWMPLSLCFHLFFSLPGSLLSFFSPSHEQPQPLTHGRD